MTNVNYYDYLPNFQVTDSATAQTIRNSQVVIDLGSTAKSFSVLGRKPIVYVTPGARPGAVDWRPASAFASALGLPMHHELATFARSLARTFSVEVEAYERYRRLYFYSDDTTGRTFDDEMKTIFDQHDLS